MEGACREGSGPTAAPLVSASDDTVPDRIELLAEGLQVQTRTVETGAVRVRPTRRAEAKHLDLPFAQESVDIRRVRVDRPVDAPVPVRRDGDTTIVSLHEEVAVVTRQLVVTEEVHIRLRRDEGVQPVDVLLHRDDIAVERATPGRADPIQRVSGVADEKTDPRVAPGAGQIASPSTGSNTAADNRRADMAVTLVGIFQDMTRAEQARGQLLQHGFDSSDIVLTRGNESSQSGGATQGASHEHHRGFFARLFGLDESDEDVGDYSEAVGRGSALLTVNLDDDSRIDSVRSLLEQAGAVDIDRGSSQQASTAAAGSQAYTPAATTATAPSHSSGAEGTFQVMEEALQVGKRQVQRGGVRVHPRVLEKPVNEQVTLHEERAVVERRPVDRVASPADVEQALSQMNRDIEIRETAEEAVVSKTARVVEEVSVGREARDHTETINDTLRRTDVEIEPLDALPANFDSDTHLAAEERVRNQPSGDNRAL